jgi:hypothetical protein
MTGSRYLRTSAVFFGMLFVVMVLYWPVTFDVPRSDFVTFLSIVDGLGWDATSLKKVVTTEFFGDERFQPLAFLLLYGEWKLFGAHVAAYHFLNELFHVANAFLFYRILLRIHREHWFALTTASAFLLAFSVSDIVGWPFHSYILCQILMSLVALELVIARPQSIAYSVAAYLLAAVQMYFYEPGVLSPIFLGVVQGVLLMKDRGIGPALLRVVPLVATCFAVYLVGLYLFSHLDDKTIIGDTAYRSTLFDPLNLWNAVFKGLTALMDGGLLQNLYLRPQIYVNELVFLEPSWLGLQYGDQLPGALLLVIVLTALLARSLFTYLERNDPQERPFLQLAFLAAVAIPFCLVAGRYSWESLLAIAPLSVVLPTCALLEWGSPVALKLRLPRIEGISFARLCALFVMLELIVGFVVAREFLPRIGRFVLPMFTEHPGLTAAIAAVQISALLAIFVAIWTFSSLRWLARVPVWGRTLLVILFSLPAVVVLGWRLFNAVNGGSIFASSEAPAVRSAAVLSFWAPYAVLLVVAAVFAIAMRPRIAEFSGLTPARRMVAALLLFEVTATIVLLAWDGNRYFGFVGSPDLIANYRWFDYLPLVVAAGLVFAARSVDRTTFAWLAFAAVVGVAYVSVVNIGRPGWYAETQSRYVYLVTLIAFGVLNEFLRPHFRRLSEAGWRSRFVIAAVVGILFLNLAKISQANGQVEAAMTHVNRLYAAAYQFLHDPAHRDDKLFLAVSPYPDHDRLAWGSDLVLWLLLRDCGLTNSVADAKWALQSDGQIVPSSELSGSQGPNRFAITFGLWPNTPPTSTLRVFGPDPGDSGLAGQWFVDLRISSQDPGAKATAARLIFGKYDEDGSEDDIFASREFSIELQRETVLSLIHDDDGFDFVLNGKHTQLSQDRRNVSYESLVLKFGPLYRMAYRKPYYYNRTQVTLGWFPIDLKSDDMASSIDRDRFQDWPRELDGYHRRKGPGPFYAEPGTIVAGDFGQGGLALQGEGWGDEETWGTWTVGRSAHLLPVPLEASVEGSDLILRADILPFIPGPEKVQIVNVFANGIPVANWLFTADNSQRVVSAIIPRQLLKGQKTLSLSFDIPNAASPSSFGIANDYRKLGVGFKWLTIKEIQLASVSAQNFYVSMRSGASEKSYAAAGWLPPTEVGVSAADPSASLVIPAPAERSKAAIAIDANVPDQQDGSRRPISVSVNGHVLGRLEPGDASATFALPDDDFFPGQTLFIEFKDTLKLSDGSHPTGPLSLVVKGIHVNLAP